MSYFLRSILGARHADLTAGDYLLAALIVAEVLALGLLIGYGVASAL